MACSGGPIACRGSVVVRWWRQMDMSALPSDSTAARVRSHEGAGSLGSSWRSWTSCFSNCWKLLKRSDDLTKKSTTLIAAKNGRCGLPYLHCTIPPLRVAQGLWPLFGRRESTCRGGSGPLCRVGKRISGQVGVGRLPCTFGRLSKWRCPHFPRAAAVRRLFRLVEPKMFR